MKPIPTILDQGNVGSCQVYATVQQLRQWNIWLDPQDLYEKIFEWNYRREPNTNVVLEYLKLNGYIQGWTTQYVGRRGAWLPLGMIYAWFYKLEWQIRIAKQVCDVTRGGLLSIKINNEVKGDGVLTEKILKEGSDHLAYLYDYDDAKQRFILVNSWGTGYGDGTGCIYLPYSLIKNTNLLATLDI